MMLNMGPSHPAMHGVIRIVVELDGETVVHSDTEIGYLHRAFEKESENATYNQVFPYTDRLNYVSPVINNVGYALAVEKLLGIEVTERCKFIRVIMSEISRVCDHLTCVGASAMELGAMSAFLYMIEAREFLWELVELVTGARLTIAYCRVGGVKADLPEDFEKEVATRFRKVRTVLKDVDGLLTKNRIFVERMDGVGVISKEDAIDYSFTGPMLRACGVPYDVRKMSPYLAYDKIEFEVPTQTSCDNYGRYLVRMAEMQQSMRIVEQAFARMPKGPINVDHTGGVMEPADMVDTAKVGKTHDLPLIQLELSPNLEGLDREQHREVMAAAKNVALPAKNDTYGNIEGLMNHFMLIMEGWGIQPPAGEAYQTVEGANGELGFYVVSDGSDKPYRVRVRPPCFAFVAGLHKMIDGGMIADIVPTFGSINMIAGELDR